MALNAYWSSSIAQQLSASKLAITLFIQSRDVKQVSQYVCTGYRNDRMISHSRAKSP